MWNCRKTTFFSRRYLHNTSYSGIGMFVYRDLNYSMKRAPKYGRFLLKHHVIVFTPLFNIIRSMVALFILRPSFMSRPSLVP